MNVKILLIASQIIVNKITTQVMTLILILITVTVKKLIVKFYKGRMKKAQLGKD